MPARIVPSITSSSEPAIGSTSRATRSCRLQSSIAYVGSTDTRSSTRGSRRRHRGCTSSARRRRGVSGRSCASWPGPSSPVRPPSGAFGAIRTSSLRDERQTVDILLDVGRRLGLQGWVLYPTRDETVAAFARYRPLLTELFRVPTPAWNTIQWLWDKRNTYSLADQLGIPTPRTFWPRTVEELDRLAFEAPVAIKPAI